MPVSSEGGVMDYVHLVGSEQVQRAAGQMRQAAEEIKSAAWMITEALREHTIAMRDLTAELTIARVGASKEGR